MRSPPPGGTDCAASRSRIASAAASVSVSTAHGGYPFWRALRVSQPLADDVSDGRPACQQDVVRQAVELAQFELRHCVDYPRAQRGRRRSASTGRREPERRRPHVREHVACRRRDAGALDRCDRLWLRPFDDRAVRLEARGLGLGLDLGRGAADRRTQLGERVPPARPAPRDRRRSVRLAPRMERQVSNRSRSSIVSRRRITCVSPSRTRTAAGRGTPL